MPSEPSENRVDLLLAAADDGRPVLPDGLPADSVGDAKKPKTVRDDVHQWRRDDADPNVLSLQKWAVIAPKGREGDELLSAITPLMRLREAEQGTKPLIYRVDPDLEAKKAVAWKQDVYWDEDTPQVDRPRYLLILGDLTQVSLDLQHALANDAFVGRIHFEDAGGRADRSAYAAYAEKVVRFTGQRDAEIAPDMVYYVSPDGSPATSVAGSRLVEPSFRVSEELRAEGKLPAASVRRIDAETVKELLSAVSAPKPSVMLSVSHGLGAPRRGWPSDEEQRRRQGALTLGNNEVLDAERLSGGAFLPGGMWFFLACFGAGTPKNSAYSVWLSQLAAEGAYSGNLATVRQSLPAEDKPGFVAALPQVALRNPEGPLAVIGHMDLAWTYAFSGVTRLAESRKTRILTALEVLVRGGRAGVGLGALMAFFQQANNELTIDYELESNARSEGKTYEGSRAERAHLWMLRNDLRGYVLLGDPAARLPIRANVDPALVAASVTAPASVSVTAPASVTASASAPASVSVSEAGDVPDSVPESVRAAAVSALLVGEEAPNAIAAKAGVSRDTLWDWFDAHRAERRKL